MMPVVTAVTEQVRRQNASRRRLWILCATLLLLALALGTPAWAQAQEPTTEQINEIARELWCPLCNGVRLDVCELRACEQMRDTISEQLTAGKDKAAIKEYFVNLYGPVVLGEPPRRGANWLPWLLPFVALLAGAAYVVYLGRRWTQRAQPAAGKATAPKPQARPSDDPYLQQVEDDLKKMK